MNINILKENMRRFGTKNLNEEFSDIEKLAFGGPRDSKTGNLIAQDTDQNNNGYPDGTERTNTSGDKILAKLAKLLKSPSSKIEIGNDQIRASNLNFGFGPASTFVVSNREDYYLMNTNKGWFRVDKSDILKAEDLYDELESIIQAGTTKRPSSRETDMFGRK